MVKTLINWVISALVLWLMHFIPFMQITFDGWLAILLAAVIIGLINALIVPVVKGLFKKANGIILLVISLIIDAGALWLASLLPIGFGIQFFPTAIIAALVLSLLNLGFSKVK